MDPELTKINEHAAAYTRRWVRWDFRLSWLNLLTAAAATVLTALAAAGPLNGDVVSAHLPAVKVLGDDAGWKAVCWIATLCSATATTLMFLHKGFRCSHRVADGAKCVASIERIDPDASEKRTRELLAGLKERYPEIFFDRLR
jgi:hypothetical protein